jgi:hypothetical protein
VSELRELRQLREEAGWLKWLVADLTLDKTTMLLECALRNVVPPSRRRPVFSYLHNIYWVSERRACRAGADAVSRFRDGSRLEPTRIVIDTRASR